MNNGDSILDLYREAFKKYNKDEIIDLDKRLKHTFNFQIHRLENVVKELNGVIPPNRQSQYFISLVKKSSGQKSIGRFTFSIQKNTLLCIPKRVTHSCRYLSGDGSGYVLSFNLDFFLQRGFPAKLITNKKFFKSLVTPYVILSDAEVKKLEVIYERIMEEYKDRKGDKTELIAIKILELLVECDRLYPDVQTNSKEFILHDILDKFNELLEKNASKQRTVKFYAVALHIHPNYLNSLCQRYTGLSAKETINTHIINEAKYLLASSSLGINEIANKLGFEHSEYFYTFFRKCIGMSPGQYRNRLV
jgi:AraC-like DNA-binding protein